jgi:hypothetical protein
MPAELRPVVLNAAALQTKLISFARAAPFHAKNTLKTIDTYHILCF